MKDTSKRVIILNNLTSPYIHQAIIVLKEFDPRFETKAILEAEKVVKNYLDKTTPKDVRQNIVPTKGLLKLTFKFFSILTAIIFVLYFIH